MSIVEQVEYREIEGFPGYRVGTDGSVWTQRKRRHAGARYPHWTKKILRFQRQRGYFTVCLGTGGQKKATKTVHRLVAAAFCERLAGQRLVRHLNDIKTDNRAENLAWGTDADNSADAIRNRKSNP